MNNKIKALHTTCMDCIFSEKDEQRQVGCSFNKIDLYREKGAEIIEAYDASNNEFFVINDRVCMHKRTPLWAKDYPEKLWKSALQEQIKIRYHAMVIFREGSCTEDLENTLVSLNNQEIPPSLLTILNRSKMAASSLVEKIHEMELDNTEWRLQTFFEEEDIVLDRSAIDIVIDSSKNYKIPMMYYVVFEVPFEIPADFSREMQSYFVDNASHAVFAHPRKDGNGMLVSYIFHKKHAGNSFNIPIENKLIEFEEKEMHQYIMSIEEICPSLKM